MRADNETMYTPWTSCSTRLRRQKVILSMASGSSVASVGTTTTWRMMGMARSAEAPRLPDSTGTSRQERTRRDSSAANSAIRLLGLGRIVGVGGEKDHPGRIAAGVGHSPVHHAREKAVRHLGQDPGAVAGGRLRPGGPAMGQVLEGGHRLADEAVAPPPVQVGHERDATGVVLERGVVQAL